MLPVLELLCNPDIPTSKYFTNLYYNYYANTGFNGQNTSNSTILGSPDGIAGGGGGGGGIGAASNKTGGSGFQGVVIIAYN